MTKSIPWRQVKIGGVAIVAAVVGRGGRLNPHIVVENQNKEEEYDVIFVDGVPVLKENKKA